MGFSLSGLSVVLCHWCLHEARKKTVETERKSLVNRAVMYLGITLALGCIFRGVKAFEYKAKIFHVDEFGHPHPILPKSHTFYALYFTMTGLHGLHVLGGVLVFIYMWLPVSKKVYQRNPEHLANRVEVSGLFWHFVDLVWIFVFPLFYLL